MGGREVEVRVNGRSCDGLRRLAVRGGKSGQRADVVGELWSWILAVDVGGLLWAAAG